MLSTLSAFLPAMLSDRLDKGETSLPLTTPPDEIDDEEGVKRIDIYTAETKAKDKEKKKKSSSNETFIVVRPPPAKSNHPLNLQLQLVPAHHSRDRSNTANSTASAATTPTSTRASTDLPSARPLPSSPATSIESEHALKRTPSIRSNRSDTSGFYASSAAVSTGSVTSFASTASTASARRMIIPLYNLSAHNVMTNTILDAGTDARVAKFNKRGLEIIDLAVLEPTEVWCDKDRERPCAQSLGNSHPVAADTDPLGVSIRRSCSGNSSLAPPGQCTSRAGTPDLSRSQSPGGSSRLSVASDHSSLADHNPNPINHNQDPVVSTTTTPTGPKKLFGRIFRKKDAGTARQSSMSARAPPSSSPSAKTMNTLPYSHSLPNSQLQSYTQSHPNSNGTLPKQSKPSKQNSPTEVLLPAVLGLAPTLCAPMNPPTGRCVTYVWLVRRWLKVVELGAPQLGSNMMTSVLGKGTMGGGGGAVYYADAGEWEVRFEWVRGKSKGERERARTGRGRKHSTADGGGSGVDGVRTRRQSSHTPSRPHSGVSGSEDAADPGTVLYGQSMTGLAISVDSPRQSLDIKRPTPMSTSRAPSPLSRGADAPSPQAQQHEFPTGGTTANHSDDDIHTAHAPAHAHDAGYDSDPEDSETPWTCSMVLTHSSSSARAQTHPWAPSLFMKGQSQAYLHAQGQSHACAQRPVSACGPPSHLPTTPTPDNIHTFAASEVGHASPASARPLGSQPIRLKVGTLSPAPHHPKVVAQLKIPFPLPDAEVSLGVLRRRLVLADGTTRSTVPSGGGGVQGLMMTAEEIKDVVCSTAFWIIVREGFGGVGKKSRKGDGWRIRG